MLEIFNCRKIGNEGVKGAENVIDRRADDWFLINVVPILEDYS